MSREDDWKQQAIQHDMGVFGARARRAGAKETRIVDEKGRVRMIEQIGRTQIVRTYFSEEGTISQVRISSVREELREINRLWDQMAPRVTMEMLEKYVSRLVSAEDKSEEQRALQLAIGHIWRRRKDLRLVMSRIVPHIKRVLNASVK